VGDIVEALTGCEDEDAGKNENEQKHRGHKHGDDEMSEKKKPRLHWTRGKIVNTWDQGNPYRIQLDNREKTEVWGPQDDDEYVRMVAK
jgi:hypothetical protein